MLVSACLSVRIQENRDLLLTLAQHIVAILALRIVRWTTPRSVLICRPIHGTVSSTNPTSVIPIALEHRLTRSFRREVSQCAVSKLRAMHRWDMLPARWGLLSGNISRRRSSLLSRPDWDYDMSARPNGSDMQREHIANQQPIPPRPWDASERSKR